MIQRQLKEQAQLAASQIQAEKNENQTLKEQLDREKQEYKSQQKAFESVLGDKEKEINKLKNKIHDLESKESSSYDFDKF